MGGGGGGVDLYMGKYGILDWNSMFAVLTGWEMNLLPDSKATTILINQKERIK